MKHHQNDQICACNNKENPLSKQKPLFKAKSLSWGIQYEKSILGNGP